VTNDEAMQEISIPLNANIFPHPMPSGIITFDKAFSVQASNCRPTAGSLVLSLQIKEQRTR
jgi:hypothetical protein